MAETKQDAIRLLTEDHRRVEALFEQFESASQDGKKEKIAREICRELKVHAQIEEEIFYPALRGKIDDDDLDEAIVEHDGAKVLINEIEAGDAAEDYWEAKVKVLQEQIEHHVKEEEKQQDNIFTRARKTDVDLEEVGAAMAARKAELLAVAETGGLPPAQPASFQHEGAQTMAWSRNSIVLTALTGAAAAVVAAVVARRFFGGEEADRGAPALSRGSRPPGPVGDSSSARQAGPEAMRDPPSEWTKVDEASDESFPASDPPGAPHID